ncbi:MAG: SIR2 family protein [Candidatus Methanosuratincola petrocarbonis]
MISKVAAVEREEPQPDPETWYHQRFGEPPDYAKLLDRLTITPAERMALLHSYFEPTEEEREQGVKTSTPAHRAIATLIKLGCIRMILTTNFDRPMEQALKEEGVIPDVISSDDDLQGAMPYVHTRCVVVKLHGDYRDTRIKNTPEELANYSQTLNEFLDRVFDEFGLIICGWSGEWDTALRNAILRSPNRRFATYWLAKGELTEEAQHIIQHRRAQVIPVESADKFFTELLEKVESLRELDRPHPLSTAVAVETVKRYLAEPRHRIRLHDLIHEETEKVCKELASERFSTQVPPFTKEFFQQRMHQYEAVVERLMAMLSALSYHDEGGNSYLLTRSIERLISAPRHNGLTPLLALQYYPALVFTYASSISALAAKRFRNLAAILQEPKYRSQALRETMPTLKKVGELVLEFIRNKELVPRPNAANEYTPLSNYLFDLLRPLLRDYLPDDTRYEETFDTFEYLLALTYMDLVRESWSPTGRFMWRYIERFEGLSEETWGRSPLAEFVRVELEKGVDGELLIAGFFGGSADRFREIVQTHRDWLEKATRGWW